MSRHEKNRNHRRSESSSDSEEVQINIKHHRKHYNESSNSEIECFSNKKNKKRDESSDSEREKKHRHKKCSSESEKKHKQDNCSSDSEHKDKCSFEEIYKYYKYRLLTDDDLMVGGSNAYLNNYHNTGSMIPVNYVATVANTSIKYNIDYPYIGAPFYVRESGVYISFFVISADQASQFCFFVNGKELPLTRYGNNAGAGQLVLRNMLQLKENDCVLIRNSMSTSTSVTSNLFFGGVLPGNDMTFLMMKIAPYEPLKCIEWDEKCLSKRKHYLYKKLMEKMLLDKELMLKGFNIRGTFYTTMTQTVATESDVVFDTQSNVNGLTWVNSSPSQIVVTEDGIYKIFFLGTNVIPLQLSLSINGVPVDYTTQGLNKGASQLTLRTIIELKKNDVISIKNHTSFNGSIVLSSNAGGIQSSLSAFLSVFKISPSCKPKLDVCKLNSYHKKSYDVFKNYLLNQKCLQLVGSPAYLTLSSDVVQKIDIDNSYDWSTTALQNNIHHNQGSTTVTINEDGIYDVFADVLTNEPSQLALFVNGTPEVSTIFGRDSGGSRCLMRQFVKLLKGDVITVRNYESHSGALTSGNNAGGELVAQNCLFMVFKLCGLDDCVPPKPCDNVKKPKTKNN